jgi:hypothetical protein
MATLQSDGDELVVSLSRLERLASLHVDLHLERSTIRRCMAATSPAALGLAPRAPLSWLPGAPRYGAVRTGAGRDFCALRGGGPILVLELEAQPFGRILLSHHDPAALASSVGLAIEG